MRIAVAVDGTRGDVHPMLALAVRLRARGHRVAVCAPPDFAADAARLELAFHPVGASVRDVLRTESRALQRGALASLRAGKRYFVASVERQFRELTPVLSDAELVFAAGTQLAAASVAEAVGARHRFVAYCPSLLRSPQQTPFAVPRASLRPWQNRLAWWAMLRFFATALGPPMRRERARLGLEPAADPYALLCGEAPVLAAEELLAPPPDDLRDAVQVVGCLHPFDDEPLPEKLEAFLQSGEPPVYVGFGSMPDPDPIAATRLVLDAVERAGTRAVLSEGWSGLGAAALPSRVIAVASVPHPALFRRVAAVVHHGGAGTTTTAARAGAPQIVVPHLLDQFHWADRVHALGLGPPPLPRHRLDADALAEAIRSTRDNELLAERAARLGQRLRAALRARPDPADLLLERAPRARAPSADPSASGVS